MTRSANSWVRRARSCWAMVGARSRLTSDPALPRTCVHRYPDPSGGNPSTTGCSRSDRPSLGTVKLAALRLRQRDGVSCGPAVAVVAGALLDPAYRGELVGPRWFAREQGRVHGRVNRVW